MEVGTDSTPSLTFPDCLNQLATGRRANRRTVPAKAPSLATLCGRGNKWDGVESVPTNDGLFADQLWIMFRRSRRSLVQMSTGRGGSQILSLLTLKRAEACAPNGTDNL